MSQTRGLDGPESERTRGWRIRSNSVGARIIRLGVIVGVLALSGAVKAGADARVPVYLFESRPFETHLGNPEIMETGQAWITEIRAARSELDFEEYYLSDLPGEALHPILDEIGRAAARGVHVRLILDARMGRTYPSPADSLGKLPNWEVRWIDFGRIGGGIQHSKFFLVDRATTVLGSPNLDWRSLEHIHELGVCIHDAPLAGFFQDLFELDWKLAGSGTDDQAVLAAARRRYPAVYRVRNGAEDLEIRPAADPRGWLPDSTKWDLSSLVESIDAAKSEIAIQVLTYSPEAYHLKETALDDALRRAAARGVQVDLLVSDWNTNHPGIDALKALVGIPHLDVRLGTVPEWSHAYIPFGRVEHCKYMVVDTLLTWIGTSNWEPSYFSTSRNVAVTIRSRALALEARRSFNASWTSETAQPVRREVDYVPKPHGNQPPPGRQVLGR